MATMWGFAYVLVSVSGLFVAPEDRKSDSPRETDTPTSTSTAAVNSTEQARRWYTDLSLAEGPARLDVDGCLFTFQGDETDAGQVLITLSDRGETLTYRFWPDVGAWQLTPEWRKEYEREFVGIPGWRERKLRLRVDSIGRLRQLWLDGRLLQEWQTSRDYAEPPTLTSSHTPEKAVFEELQVKTGNFVTLDLESYCNTRSEHFYTVDAAALFRDADGFRHEPRMGQPYSLDIGKLTYRDAHLKKGPFQGISFPYIFCDAMSSDPQRAIFRVPVRFYDRVHLLCYADGDKGEVPRAAIRFMKVERARFLTKEFGLVPENGVQILDGPTVGAHECKHVVVTINPADFQEFLTYPENHYLEFELTRPVVMDSNTFEHPAGPPSSLHVLALALEVAPVEMRVVSDVPGHLFERPEDAVMKIALKSNRDSSISGIVETVVTSPGRRPKREKHPFALPARSDCTINIPVGDTPTGKSGFRASLGVSDTTGELREMVRETSFAMVPRFARKAEDSPFGMWSFFERHHGADIETTADVMRKAGVKGTLCNFVLGTDPSTWDENARHTEILRAYGIEPNWGCLAGIANSALEGLGNLDEKFAWIHAHPQVRYYNLFWETTINPQKTLCFPPEICGRAAAEWNEEEQERINTYLRFGKTWAQRARKDAPQIQLCFGNGFPMFIAAMLRAGFPLEFIDGLGLDFDMYTSAPEDQPSMWYAPFSGIYYLRELRKIYRCEDKPIWLTEAIYCPTSPIWITERQQADYYVRAHLLALAMGVERFGMCAEPIDPDGWYHYSHYGPVGLCHATPEMNPREAFCAYSTMTGVIDDAKFDAMVDIGSPHVYGLRFLKKDGSAVHALWTVHGSRRLSLGVDAMTMLNVIDRDGRNITQNVVRRRQSDKIIVTLSLDESPIYLIGTTTFDDIGLSGTEPIPPPKGTKPLLRFETLNGWQCLREPLPRYAEINPSTPIAWVDLDVQVDRGMMRVRKPDDVTAHPLETLCMVLQRTGDPVLIPAETKAIGVSVEGYHSWGRVVFILEDAKGHRWVSARSQTPIDIDGQAYLETELPKAPDERFPGYRGYRAWHREADDSIPEYPLRLTGLLLEIRTHAIHGPDLVPLSPEGYRVKAINLRE